MNVPAPIFDHELCLRPCVDVDAATLAAAVVHSADSVGRWLPWCHARYSLDDARQFISEARRHWESGEGPFDLAVEASGQFAGCIRLRRLARDPAMGNLGYWIRSDLQGRGLAVRAARLACRIAFGALALRHLEIVAARDNFASRRVAERLGARFQGFACPPQAPGIGADSDAVYLLCAEPEVGDAQRP